MAKNNDFEYNIKKKQPQRRAAFRKFEVFFLNGLTQLIC